MKRAVGYCTNTGGALAPGCTSYHKGTFLLQPASGEEFLCKHCHKKGLLVTEQGSFFDVAGERCTLSRVQKSSYPFKEVRVEYDFDANTKCFRSLAVVKDDSLEVGNSYLLQSPLIKTEKRALKVAEALLAGLQDTQELKEDVPRTYENLLSFDEDLRSFSTQLQQLQKKWTSSTLLRNAVVEKY